jgi:hypothetical protein
MTSIRLIRPAVMVPVLSSTTVSIRRVDSRTCGPLIRMPSWAPRPVPTMSAVGVASPSAQGQAMIRTATAAVNAASVSPVRANQATRVPSASRMTIGTNTPLTRSASRCTAALPFWASSTSLAICASWVSAPTRSARTSSRPAALSVPPITGSPGATSTGTGSPVTIEASTAEAPEVTTPSVAIFSPGRTTNCSPTASPVTGIRTSIPSRSTATSLAPIDSKAARAAPDRCLARLSRYRPASRNTVTAAATSRYSSSPRCAGSGSIRNSIRIPGCPASPKNRAYTDHANAAETPIEIRVSIVAAPWRRFFHAAVWNGHAPHTATGAANVNAAHCQLTNCSTGTIETTSTGTVNAAATSSRRPSSARASCAGDASTGPRCGPALSGATRTVPARSNSSDTPADAGAGAGLMVAV